MRVKLRDPEKRRVTITHEVRPYLFARGCDVCGRVFGVPRALGKGGRPTLRFSEPLASNKANFAVFDVCSYGCAEVLVQGAWRKVKGYGNVRKRVMVLFSEVSIPNEMLTEEQLVAEWEAREEHRPGQRFVPMDAQVVP